VSTYGIGLLGYALGRRIGPGYASALSTRVLQPLELKDTFVTVPTEAQDRRTVGSNTDLAPASPWHWGVLAPAGGLVSSVRDQLALVRAEIDAAGNGAGALRPAMRFSQEAQLDQQGENEGLGMQIDPGGRYWVTGATAGFHSFFGFDTKTHRGVVILASTALTPVDHLAELAYDILGGKQVPTPTFPTADELASYAGTYDLAGTRVEIAPAGHRLYVTGPNEPRFRLVPIARDEFWLEEIQGILGFRSDGTTMHLALMLPSGQRILAVRQ
jgi:CubicO group peptidase (beta-lactamase class C family)